MGFILKDAPNSVWNLREWALKYVAKPPSVGLPLQKSDSRLQNGRHWVSISFQPLIEWWACLDTPSWMLNNFASSPHKKSKLFFQWLALIYVCYVMFWTARCCKYFCAQCSGLFMSWVVTFLTQMWYWLFCLYFSGWKSYLSRKLFCNQSNGHIHEDGWRVGTHALTRHTLTSNL